MDGRGDRRREHAGDARRARAGRGVARVADAAPPASRADRRRRRPDHGGGVAAARIYEPARLRTAPLAAALGVLTLSAWVAVDGVVFDLAGLGTCRDPANEWLCLYVPEYSPLWRPFVEFTRPTMRATIVAAYFA